MKSRFVGSLLVLAGFSLLCASAGCSRRSHAEDPQPPQAPPAAGSPASPGTSQPGPGAGSTPAAAHDLAPVFFGYDSADLDDGARAVLDRNAKLLREHPEWRVTIEGHCDERGTIEYNVALGERRASVARAYLVDAGVAADRVQAISFGKERPFDEGHDEAAWAKNRRAHVVLR